MRVAMNGVNVIPTTTAAPTANAPTVTVIPAATGSFNAPSFVVVGDIDKEGKVNNIAVTKRGQRHRQYPGGDQRRALSQHRHVMRNQVQPATGDPVCQPARCGYVDDLQVQSCIQQMELRRASAWYDECMEAS